MLVLNDKNAEKKYISIFVLIASCSLKLFISSCHHYHVPWLQVKLNGQEIFEQLSSLAKYVKTGVQFVNLLLEKI